MDNRLGGEELADEIVAEPNAVTLNGEQPTLEYVVNLAGVSGLGWGR